MVFPRRRGGIGRHAILRGQWRTLCEFDSRRRHQHTKYLCIPEALKPTGVKPTTDAKQTETRKGSLLRVFLFAARKRDGPGADMAPRASRLARTQKWNSASSPVSREMRKRNISPTNRRGHS